MLGPMPAHSLATPTKPEATVMDTAREAVTQTELRTSVHRRLPR